MNRMIELLKSSKTGSRSRGGGYEGMIIADREKRRTSDPLVLLECGHAHRTEGAAIHCAEKQRNQYKKKLQHREKKS